jgi:hypothetical protein
VLLARYDGAMKGRRMRWTARGASTGRRRNTYWVWRVNLKCKDPCKMGGKILLTGIEQSDVA